MKKFIIGIALISLLFIPIGAQFTSAQNEHISVNESGEQSQSPLII